MADRISSLLPIAMHRSGVVIEAERVVGRILDEGRSSEWLDADDVRSVEPFSEAEFRDFPPCGYGNFEIHHGFDVPKEYSVRPPIGLEDLIAACEAIKMVVCGWFLFADECHWMYRSNCFATVDEYRGIADGQHKKLRSWLGSRRDCIGVRWKQKTICEQLLGIWNMNFMVRH